MAAFVISAFRGAFPEFTDATRYPDAMINVWASLAIQQLDPCIWGNSYTLGTQLMTAHNLVLANQNVQTSKNGGAPGTFGGVANSKTVGAASVAYDSANTSVKDAGFWNLTNYGKQFYQLVRIFGTGAVQL